MGKRHGIAWDGSAAEPRNAWKTAEYPHLRRWTVCSLLPDYRAGLWRHVA